MAKKPNEPFKQYISIPNNSEIYKLGKALTNKDIYDINSDNTLAITHISDNNKNLTIQISDVDIIKNPTVLLKTATQEVVFKVDEKLANFDQITRDTFLALAGHWQYQHSQGLVENDGFVYCKLDTIHFDYRGLSGKNKESTMPEVIYSNYIGIIESLRNTKVTVDVSKEDNPLYDKIKRMNIGAIEGYLLDKVRYVYNTDKTKMIGIAYDLGVIGEIYFDKIPQVNNKYPTAILQLDARNYAVAKNIGNYLCYLHRCNEKTNNLKTKLNFYSLMLESDYAPTPPYIQRGIDRFIKHLNKIAEVLIVNSIIYNIDIPIDIQSKNYKDKQIVIHWRYF